MAQTDDRSKWAVLALARFVLAAIVLLGHINYLPGDHPWTKLGPLMVTPSAVYGFLIISGYSIAASLARSPEGFFERRLRRIWPTYLVSLAMGVAVATQVARPMFLGDQVIIRPLDWTVVLAAATMTQTFLAPALSTDGQIWSLAVEWWAYVVAPVFHRATTRLVLGALAASWVVYWIIPLAGNPANTSGGRMFATLLWWWLAGFLYFRLRRTLAGYAILIVPAMLAIPKGEIGLSLFVAIGAIALSEISAIAPRVRALFNWLGDVSYPLYLVHVPIWMAFYLARAYEPAWVAVISLILAAIILHAIDIPLRRPRARIVPQAA